MAKRINDIGIETVGDIINFRFWRGGRGVYANLVYGRGLGNIGGGSGATCFAANFHDRIYAGGDERLLVCGNARTVNLSGDDQRNDQWIWFGARFGIGEFISLLCVVRTPSSIDLCALYSH